MKNRVLTAVLGICVVMTALTGCGQNEKETELQTLEIASVEVVTESGAEAAETEFLELDFSELEEEDGVSVEVSTGDLIEGEETEEMTEAETVEAAAEANSRKPGVSEEETDLTEEVTEEVKKDTSKKESTKKDSTEKIVETAKSETVHTEKKTELTSLEMETVQQKSETVPESEKVVASERETEAVTEVETETETEVVTDVETESETEAVTEVETESETEVVTEVETESETEVVTEVETESETEAVTEVETESETEVVTEVETESETEVITEAETESETEAVTEVETESEMEDVQLRGIMTVNDRVNVRMEPSTEAEISALFTPGMKLLVVDTEEEWAHVRFESENGLTDGYIKVEFLYSAENIYYAKEKVNVRQEASTDSEKVGELLADDKVILLEEAADGWMKVCYSTAEGIVEAYVKGEFLEQAELMAGMSALAAEVNALEVAAENEAETEVETEAATEAETETETEAATEVETETETEVTTEVETETETEAATEAETETETEAATEVETENETEESEAADELVFMTVCDRVNVRKEADTDSDALDLLIPGNVFELVAEQEEWSLIRYNTEDTAIEGYIKTEFILAGDTIYEATEKVNVREEASTDSEKVGQLLAGDLVVVIEDEEEASEQTSDAVQEEEWFNVHFSADSKLVDAYVKAEFLKQVDPEELLFDSEDVQSSDADSTADEGNADTPSESDAAGTAEDKSSVSDADTKDLSNTADADSDSAEKTDETEASVITLSSGIAGQLELTKLLFPEVASVGIIYSAEDKNAAAQITDYEKYAVSYGMDLQTTEILDAMDIDLAASILVGSVDCVLCLDDTVVNDLVQTICAYADEMEIPVIGISEAQVSMGCVASFDGKAVIWNEAEADGFNLDLSALSLSDVKIYQ